MNLVVMQNRTAVTSSLVVAESFEKQHKNVIQAIENIKKDELIFQQMFFEGNEPDSYGRNRKVYYMNRDGFTFLVGGFTGEKANKFKWHYIQAFNEMEKQLLEMNRPSYEIMNPIERAAKWIEEQKEKILLEEKLEEQKPKVFLADSISGSIDSISIKALAALLTQNGVKIGQNKLYEWLRNNNYLIKSGDDYNLPLQSYLNNGYFEIKLGTRPDKEGNTKTTKKTIVTPTGQNYFIKKFLKYNI